MHLNEPLRGIFHRAHTDNMSEEGMKESVGTSPIAQPVKREFSFVGFSELLELPLELTHIGGVFPDFSKDFFKSIASDFLGTHFPHQRANRITRRESFAVLPVEARARHILICGQIPTFICATPRYVNERRRYRVSHHLRPHCALESRRNALSRRVVLKRV